MTLDNMCILSRVILGRFIIAGCNVNNVRYTDDTLLIDNSERKPQHFLESVIEDSDKRTINLKETKNMVINRRKSPTCEFRIDVNIKQVKKIKYMGNA